MLLANIIPYNEYLNENEPPYIIIRVAYSSTILKQVDFKKIS